MGQIFRSGLLTCCFSEGVSLTLQPGTRLQDSVGTAILGTPRLPTGSLRWGRIPTNE